MLALAGSALAGGGPENVAVIINPSSESSKTIANHYIKWRNIPPSNVIYINWTGGLEYCQGQFFRDKILAPAVTTLEERKLTAQIDYLVYSSDFPWRVDLKSLYPNENFPPMFKPFGSLTGLTYLAPLVLGGNPAVVMPNVNWYVPGPNDQNQSQCQDVDQVSSRAFRFRYLWDQNGKHTRESNEGQRYILSTMLGVTQGRGNSVEEVLDYLKRSIAADGRRPRGSVYFMRNGDIRSLTRHACFDGVAAKLSAMGVKANVMQGTVPQGARNVIGLTTGADTLDLRAANIEFEPGAICDNLTSLGGVLKQGAGQTPLSNFLKLGAAGASGTVIEPHAIQAKFPLPSLHLHYARGCSLAEAFYQSVAGPYQLLIVGDPLCQPWAQFPKVTIPDVKPGQQVKGTLSITPKASGAALIELFVNGRVVARAAPGATFHLDSTKLPDGYHELRVVAVKRSAIETQGRAVVPIRVANHGVPLELTANTASTIPRTGKVTCTVRQPGATAIVLRHNRRDVGRVNGETGEVEVSAAELGPGPVTLQAFSEGETPAVSPPLNIVIQ